MEKDQKDHEEFAKRLKRHRILVEFLKILKDLRLYTESSPDEDDYWDFYEVIKNSK